MTTEQAKQTAETILSQLGGHKFRVMTGAKNTAFDADGSLSFRLPRAENGINYVKITLNGLDLYDVEFRRVHGRTNTLKAEEHGIYADMLRGLFERVTGLRTSLTAVYA